MEAGLVETVFEFGEEEEFGLRKARDFGKPRLSPDLGDEEIIKPLWHTFFCPDLDHTRLGMPAVV